MSPRLTAVLSVASSALVAAALAVVAPAAAVDEQAPWRPVETGSSATAP